MPSSLYRGRSTCAGTATAGAPGDWLLLLHRCLSALGRGSASLLIGALRYLQVLLGWLSPFFWYEFLISFLLLLNSYHTIFLLIFDLEDDLGAPTRSTSLMKEILVVR